MKFLAGFLLVVLIVLDVAGQTVKLSGTVYDHNGAVIVGAKVIATDEAKKINETTTNQSGEYALELKPANYTLRFEAVGFKNMVWQDFRLVNSTKKAFNFDIVMEAGEPND
ncbi:MAG TPA: carboxypeptidase-like regulatory domain-containing protein [Pyrinomonadaceae bacterium]|nr:carboxypeptidase-like regulatory domain-containing protein [Pyrinomonadaceae bacterium]